MTPELTALALAALWQMVMVAVAGAVMNRELGLGYNFGPRDRAPEASPLLGRLRRAVANHAENLGLFAAAVLVVTLSGRASPLHCGLRLGLPRRAHPLSARLCLRLDALAFADLAHRACCNPGDDPRRIIRGRSGGLTGDPNG